MSQEHGKRIEESLVAITDHSLRKEQLGHVVIRKAEGAPGGYGKIVALLPTSRDLSFVQDTPGSEMAGNAEEVGKTAVLLSRAPEMRDMLLLIDSWLSRFGMPIQPDGEIHEAVKKVLSMVPEKSGGKDLA